MDCTIPYKCPGHECCNRTTSEDSIIYENDQDAQISHTRNMEGDTADTIEMQYEYGYNDLSNVPYVTLSCCHNQPRFFKQTRLVRPHSPQYNDFISYCNSVGKSGCGDVQVVLPTKRNRS